jgi:hypothetical protein
MEFWSRVRAAARLGVAGLAVVAGCGKVNVTDADARGAVVDAETPDASADAGAVDSAQAACDPTAAFGTVAPLADFNTAANEDAVFLSDDQLTALFSSDRPGGAGGYDLWIAVRSDVQARFSAPSPVAGVNSAADERQPVLSADSLRLLFMSNQGSTAYRLVEATRNTITGGFAPPVMVAGLDSGAGEISPWLSADNTQIYFGSGRAGGLGGNDVYVSDLSAAGAGDPADLTVINSTADDASPVLSRDGLTLYLASKRPDSAALGNDDIWVSRRASVSAPFGAPAAVPELNSSAADGPRWLSPDGCTLYFTSTRNGGQGGYDLYSSTRGR